MIKDAVAETLAKNKEAAGKDDVTVAEALENVSREKLYRFIVRLAQNNPELTNAVLLEFLRGSENGNKYAAVIRKGLQDVQFDDDGYYNEGTFVIDVLERWLEKAKTCVEEGDCAEAVLICKACIEEYTDWLYDDTNEYAEYLEGAYNNRPFKILSSAVQKGGDEISAEELYRYCKSEMEKEKYEDTYFFTGFNNVLMYLAPRVDPDGFIAAQDELLSKEDDKSSWQARQILQRKLDFYRLNNQHKKAWQLIEDNIQIDSFRKELTEKKIEEKKYGEAKKLISDYLSSQKTESSSHEDDYDEDDYDGSLTGRNRSWIGLLLEIARHENDLPVIRKISRYYISSGFDETYYRIYKSSFSADEWPGQMQELIDRYQDLRKKDGFSDDVAALLVEEKAAERLMLYIEKYLHIQHLQKYHSVFAQAFPEETVALFRRALDQFVDAHSSRGYYALYVTIMNMMLKIKGGGEMIVDMVDRYRAAYKTRKVMLEVFSGFVKDNKLGEKKAGR
jgi:hypothetical protein